MLSQEQFDYFKTQEHRLDLEKLVAEPEQKTLASRLIMPLDKDKLSFVLKQSLSDLEVEILVKQDKEAPADWEEKDTIEERGPDIANAHGLLTHRGLITWIIKEGKDNPWLYCILTEAGAKLKDQILNTD